MDQRDLSLNPDVYYQIKRRKIHGGQKQIDRYMYLPSARLKLLGFQMMRWVHVDSTQDGQDFPTSRDHVSYPS